MEHGAHASPADPIDIGLAREVSETMHALSTSSRLRILSRLYAGSCSVSDLAISLGMEGSAVSHQLRILRHLGLVVGRREGRSVLYELHDEHVGQLLAEAMSHVEHLRLCLAEHSHGAAAVVA